MKVLGSEGLMNLGSGWWKDQIELLVIREGREVWVQLISGGQRSVVWVWMNQVHTRPAFLVLNRWKQRVEND